MNHPLPAASDVEPRLQSGPDTADGSIVSAFARVARTFPDRIALSGAHGELRYRELAARADVMAAQLRRRGVGAGDIVGMFLPRSADAIVAMLAILKAGAAYLPFDTSYPHRLLRYIYDDAQPSLMLVGNDFDEAPFWRGVALDLATLAATPPSEDGDSDGDGDGDGDEMDGAALAGSLAYVMYTSGSTGRPKGVCIPHRGVLRLVVDADYVDLGPGQVLLQLAPLSFDASTFEIWGALLNGGRLAICERAQPSLDDIGELIAQQGVTTLWLTAGLFHLMVDHRIGMLAPLLQLLAGGDVLSPGHVARVLRELPQCRLINGYGPTENTTFSCCYTVPHDWTPGSPIPIGTAIGQTQAHVLDERGQPVADGDEGELYLGGAGLALGYFNRPELTAERFVEHPLATAPDARLYRTGDRVRRGADGQLEFLGRNDRQLKINGKRVELDEIEQLLRGSGLVQDAATVSYDSGGYKRIAAFAVPPADRLLSVDELRRYLRQELPDYMVPAVIVLLERLPLTPTGKIDRARLPLPAVDGMRPTAARVAGIDPQVRRIWCEVLACEDVDPDGNFFDLGGSSLQMVRLHAELRQLRPNLTLLDLFRRPSLRELCTWLQGSTPEITTTLLSSSERAARRNDALLAARSRARPYNRI